MTARYLTPAEFAGLFRLDPRLVQKRIRQHAGAPKDPTTIRAINVGSPRKPRYRIPATEVTRYERDLAS